MQLIQEKKKEDALNVFKDLLETELLDQVEKPEVPDGRSRPMLSLKYACFKNIASIQAELENYEDAIDNYWEAANLDDSDVILWYRIGTLAMKISNLELACSAFKQGLKCNPNHWPCLDSIITALYAVPDHMNCLLYISMALERDSTYIRGLVFREKIFKDVPCLEECYKMYNSDWALDPPLDTAYDHVIGERLLEEAKDVAEKWAEACKSEFTKRPLPILPLRKPLTEYTWLELGESLVNMHKHILENDINFASKINIVVAKLEEIEEKKQSQMICVEDSSMEVENVINNKFDLKLGDESGKTFLSKKDDEEEKKLEEDQLVFEIEDETPVSDSNTDNLMEMEAEDDRKSASSDIEIIEIDDSLKISEADVIPLDEDNGLKEPESEADVEMGKLQEEKDPEKSKDSKKPTENPVTDKANKKENDKSCDESEKQNDKSNDKYSKNDEKSNDKSEGKDESQKVKKRRRSSLCFLQQWAWSSSNTRRSARVRGSNRKEAERDDVLLEETIRRIFPSTLL